MVTLQDRQILHQSNAHRVNYSPTGRIRANKGLKYTRFISQRFTDRQVRKVYYDPKHAAGFGSVEKLVKTSKHKKRDVEEWLVSQNTYTLHKPVRKRFPRNPYTVTNIDDV